LDYGKPGQPALTDAERSQIRYVLGKVRPCQRPLVRYAFPNDDSEEIVTFFALRDLGAGEGVAFTHVIGEPNTYFAPWTGEMHVGPIGADDSNAAPQKRLGIEWDIEHQPCSR
jgi:hypothetical protein